MYSNVLKKKMEQDPCNPEDSKAVQAVKKGEGYSVPVTMHGRLVYRVHKSRKMSLHLWGRLCIDRSQNGHPVEGLPEEDHYLLLL